MKWWLFVALMFSCGVGKSPPPADLGLDKGFYINEDTRKEATTVDVIVEKAIKEESVAELHTVKPHTDNIRSNTVDMDSLLVDIEKHRKVTDERILSLETHIKEQDDKSSFRNKLPWAILFAGVAVGLIGRFMFNSIGATIGGGVISFSSIVVSQYHDVIAKWGMIIFMVLAIVIGVSIVTKQEIIKKGKKDD